MNTKTGWILPLILIFPLLSCASTIVKLKPEVINQYPHDPEAFTQGLFFYKGFLYESTGQHGKSTMRKVDPASGRILESVSLPSISFGEGATLFNGRIYQLTWHSALALIYTPEPLTAAGSMRYPSRFEGWGITAYKGKLYISDGSDTLRIINPSDFSLEGTVKITKNGTPVYMLNELETVGDHIYANIWQNNSIIRFSPITGKVDAEADLSSLVPSDLKGHPEFVLNGIAWNKKNNSFYITGKKWNRLYEIYLK